MGFIRRGTIRSSSDSLALSVGNITVDGNLPVKNDLERIFFSLSLGPLVHLPYSQSLGLSVLSSSRVIKRYKAPPVPQNNHHLFTILELNNYSIVLDGQERN